MGANAFEYNVKLNLNAETKMAKAQINDLQRQLQDISKLQVDFKGINNLTNEINEASTAAMKLQANLQAALNPDTGTLDFSKFNNSIRKSGESISGLAQSLLSLGPQGEKAFVSLADSISRSEVPLMRTNKLINGLWDNLKKTAGWQVSSSVIHGVMGQYQQAMGYAKALDKSLNDIRIVTGQSADQMARFAKEANAAAKKLSTTTTDYTNASLIYYQQGLSDAEVKKRSDITVKMANATGTNAAKVSDQLTSIWNNFDNGTKSLEHYADVMTALGAATASSTDEIAKGIQKFAAISDTVGLSYEYAASALATITATTRESADTVGNSLKTLFSRIQGLQLGETLDDGTTLNKYSTALAKVGISIKDSSGALRDMNSILDEMGTKWHTLAEDQQMALAQTVGGVRQYTQIMTLMENWDFFKENLNTANTATGALTMQAEIYADSWEAASQKMRASMESVWDTLIDSDSFKSLLNIGSTILDGINNALAGIGGGSGVLATAAGIFGTVFKTQISQSLVDGIHTITHLTPKAMAAERQKRTDTINEMITTVNDPGATPYMGDYERQRTVDILRMQRDASEERSKRRSKMSSEAQAMDVELESSLGTLYDRRKSIAAEMDTYQAQIDRGRQATADDLTFFSGSYDLKEKQPTSSVADAKRQLENARRNGKNTSGYEARLAEAEAQVAAQKNYGFGLALLKDSDSGATADQNASLGKALEQLGIREANAEDRTAKIITELSAKKDPGEYSIAEGKLVQRSENGKILGGNAYELFADLLNLTPDERVKFRNQEQFADPQRQALGTKLDASLKGLEDFIKKDLDGKGITDQQERSKLIGSYIQKTIGGIQTDALSGLGVNTTLKGMQRGGAMDIYQGAKGKRTLEITDANVEQAANKIKAQQDKLRQENYASVASATTGLVTGGFQTAAGMQGLEGAFKALSNGDIIGASAGAASAFYNLKTSRQNLSEAFSDLDPLSQNLKKSAEKTKLLQEQDNLNESVRSNQYWRKIEEANLENLKKEYNKKKTDGVMVDHEGYEARITDYENRIKQRKEDEEKASGRLNEVSKGLEQLKDIDTTKFPKSMGKLGDVLEFASKNADKAAGAFQAAQIAMKLTSEGLNYIYNTNQRNAEKAAATATQLEGAYAMNQRNHNALISGIEEYNKATEKLKDTNLTGAAKSAAIYEQNQQALDLAMKYNLETTQMGDTIKIDEKVLKQAEEDSIQSMQVSKYAMNAAKIDSKEAQNKREEERLERETGVDEGLIYGGLTAGAGALAAALMFIPGVNLGVAAAAGIAAGAALITGKGVDILTDTMRENSAIDKAVALTRETGSTAWMDKEDASELSGLSEKELQKYRKDIESLAKSEFAAEQAERQMKEANANDILRNNDETEDFKHANKLQEGLIKQQEDWYENQKEYHWWNSTSKSRIEDAKSIESELGLTGSVVWQDDRKNGRLTYTTSDGQTGEVSYDTMAKTIATKEGKADADQYIDTMMDTYDAIKDATGGNEDAAAGMLSLMSGGDFESATIKEMEAAQDLIKDFDLDVINKNNKEGLAERKRLAETLGIDTEGMSNADIRIAVDNYAKEAGYEGTADMLDNFKDMQDYTSPIQNLMEEQFVNNEFYKDLFAEGTTGAEMFGSMDQATMKEFYSELSFIASTGGVDAGRAYISSMTGMLEGIDPDRMGEAIRALTAVDWSDWDGLDSQVIDILDEFDIKIDNSNEHLQNFVNTIQTAAKSLPNLADSMTSLIQVAGKLEDLKIGDSIDAATMQALKDQGYDLSDETFTTWNGESVLIGDTDAVQEGIRDKIANTYGTYMDTVDATRDAILQTTDSEKDKYLDTFLDYDPDEFLSNIGVSGNRNSERIAQAVLGEDGYNQLLLNKADKAAIEADLEHYKIGEDGKLLYRADVNQDWSTATEATADQRQAYDTLKIRQQTNADALAIQYDAIMAAAEEARDPAKVQEIAEQYVSTFNSYEDAMADETTQKMIADGTLKESDALSYYASKYPELIEYVNAYNEAVASNNPTLKEQAENQMRVGVAMQDALANYTAMTGKKADLADLNATITALKNDMDEETLAKYNDEELVRLAEETMIAGVGWSSLQKHGSSWNSAIEKLDDKDATAAQLNQGYEAAGKMGKAMQQYLGLTEYDITGITKQDKDNPIVKAINELNIDITKILNKDVNETNKLRAYLVSQSTAGQSLSTKLGITGFGTKDETANDTNAGKAYKAMKAAVGEDGSIDEDKLAEANQDMLASLQSGEITWEEYKASVEMATGGQKTANRTGVARTYYDSTGQRLQKNADGTFSGVGGAMHGRPAVGNVTTVERQTRINNNGQVEVNMGTDSTGATKWVTHNETTHGANENLDGSPMDPTKTTTGGGGGGGGGGGPTKVAVKSAQELMTRYKTIDAKSSIAEMQKANALTQKDLLYGEAKIAQLQKINGLLVKQQRLTADRIEEERQYLEEDKKHLQEVLDRYNKDKKDKDGKVKEGEELLELEFNSEGIITNYKQTIGAMAEELAAFYRDGELTSEEGKKAEELQKKIADLNVVIQDYEDSLNQLQTSIDTYEQTLYEMFANQAEELAYKVTYKLEMENDDLTYVKFYATALKDSTDRMYDYIDLIGQQAGEFKDQIEVYNQGVEDLISNAENNPMYTFATGGLEGVLTAEDVTNLRTYRDGLNTTYTSMVALRKEVEEKVLKVFDEWHDKVNKNVDSISRYTDMLSQFKDVINVIGKETLGLSDAFMKNFEQKSIDQSRDNIEAAKQQYESLAEIYANAQDKLEAARADGNEETIKHWEEVVDKTQSEMEGAQDAILTTLNHTLNLIAEQFTNAINEAIDTFNESIYEFGGLDGLIADYEQIREQRDLMVEDYEKIYSLNKLNRQIEKTLDDTKIIAGKQKLLEFQEKINDLNRNNVELSKFELEYLQAEYELRLAEIELENARTAKDTVRLSRDSEGNWSYIYTQNESAIDEAQQKYEDALYKMQQTTQEYQNEMSASMMEVAQTMRDEIAALNIQELGPEKFQEEMDRIKEKYAEQLAFYESELNKSISTSKNLYDEDWQNYSAATGYKLSAAQDWADSYSETTLGGLMGSGQYMSDYASTIMASADVMTESMSQAAITYFNESNKALETYGTSIEGFSSHLQTTTSQITASSKQATADVTTMAADMVDAFSKVADEVKNWQDTFGEEISMLLDEIGNKIQEINDLIKKSNELGKNNYSSTDLIGQAEAIELINKETFNNKNLFGTWTFDEENGVARGTYTDASGEVKQDVERNIVEFTGQLVEMIDELTGKYYDAKTDSPEREMYGEQLKKLFQDYWKFKNIVNRIYDLTDITIPEPKLDKDKVEGLATGGYTGEWGDSGKLAFLHEKELVLNKDDTANFLDALNISRQLVEMIEMNARASSLGLGEMYASSIQDHNQTLEQSVSITAEFPNATDHSEIEEAFDNLINMASQYAYRN